MFPGTYPEPSSSLQVFNQKVHKYHGLVGNLYTGSCFDTLRDSGPVEQEKFSLSGIVSDITESAHGVQGQAIAVPYARPDYSPPPVKKKKKK